MRWLLESFLRNNVNLVRKTVDKRGRQRVATGLLVCECMLACEAGIKKMLEKSASYPRGFGLAVAALLPTQPLPVPSDSISLKYEAASDDEGALDDILKGPQQCWWRKL